MNVVVAIRRPRGLRRERSRASRLACHLPLYFLCALFASSVLAAAAGCSTGRAGTAAVGAGAPPGGYKRVLVRDFEDGVSSHERGAVGAKGLEMNTVRRQFADEVARAIARASAFSSVDRSGHADADTLLVEGIITTYAAGNVVADIPVVGRVLPTSNEKRFAATVRLRDGASGHELESFEVDQSGASSEGGSAGSGSAEAVAVRILKDFGGAAGAAAIDR